MMLRRSMLIFTAAAMASLSSIAESSVTVDVQEVGPNVIVTSFGTFDPTGLNPVAPQSGFVVGGIAHPYRSVYASRGFLGLGSDPSLGGYSGLTGPSQFGSGGIFDASSSSGSGFIVDAGLLGGSPTIYISTVIVNGSPISQTSATETFLGQSFASLGLTPGQYLFTAPNDRVTVNIGGISAAVPEISTWAMMLFGFGAIGFVVRRSRRRTRQAEPQDGPLATR